jgi:hypothetical protein
MGQSVVSDAYIRGCEHLEPDRPIPFLTADLVDEQGDRALVAIVRSKDEFLRWIHSPLYFNSNSRFSCPLDPL